MKILTRGHQQGLVHMKRETLPQSSFRYESRGLNTTLVADVGECCPFIVGIHMIRPINWFKNAQCIFDCAFALPNSNRVTERPKHLQQNL